MLYVRAGKERGKRTPPPPPEKKDGTLKSSSWELFDSLHVHSLYVLFEPLQGCGLSDVLSSQMNFESLLSHLGWDPESHF